MYWLVVPSNLVAQQRQISIQVLDSVTNLPIPQISVICYPQKKHYITNHVGKFNLEEVKGSISYIVLSGIGYRQQMIFASQIGITKIIHLRSERMQLSEVKISSLSTNPNQAITDTDVHYRGVSNSQEALRIVPGLFISQHQGGGKAEQIFLRGFDNDHGKDIALSADGVPINMVSHAHGQGYADSHFIIPETIEKISYKKGLFDADKGDLAVSGWVDYSSKNDVTDMVKLEAGQFKTYRGMFIINLLNEKARTKEQSLYIASEYRYSDSYFDHPQHFKRGNFFTKYNGNVSAKSRLMVSLSAFSSSWHASGQLPELAVEENKVPYFGAIDPNEGGVTSRYNANLMMVTTVPRGIVKNQFYYSKYKFDLHSNFTLFLNDEVNGDEIRQRESRDLFGYNGAFKHSLVIAKMSISGEIGLNSRFDLTQNSELSHTVNRFILLDPIKLGNISQWSAGPYITETLIINDKLRINLGARYDHFFYQYQNKLDSDSTFNGKGFYTSNNGSVSPKLSLYYSLNEKSQIYLFLGKGLNSNDARSVVANKKAMAIPGAYGIDLGGIFKPTKAMVLSTTAWYSYLQQEFTYGGDGGTIEFSGRTRRIGLDLSARYQPLKSVYVDLDLNFADGRSLDNPKNENRIPFSPIWSSTGGVTYMHQTGLNGSLRYRYLADRPANENFSLTAAGYFINDMVLNYTTLRYELGITINNLFNLKWKESQFVEQTRLKGASPDEGLTFTPGTKFATLFHMSYFLK